MSMLAGSARNPLGSRLNDIGRIQQILSMFNGGDPAQIAANMARQNPEFARFVDANKNKSVEQLANEYGIDLNMLRGLIK